MYFSPDPQALLFPETPLPKDKLWSPEFKDWSARDRSFVDLGAGSIDDKLELFNSTMACLSEGMKGINIEPLEHQLPSTLEEISLKERAVYQEKAKAACRVVCTTIAPNDGENLFKLVQQPQEEKVSEELLSLLMAYKNAPTKNIKTQILSLYAYNYSFERLKELHEPFEKLSSRQIKKAREHSKKVGSGFPLQKKVSHRVRIDMVKLEHFLSFIDRPYFYQDVAFGVRKIKLESGEQFTMPNVIRTVARATMIAQYMEFCESENFDHLSRSSPYRVLSVRQASQRKSLSGIIILLVTKIYKITITLPSIKITFQKSTRIQIQSK